MRFKIGDKVRFKIAEKNKFCHGGHFDGIYDLVWEVILIPYGEDGGEYIVESSFKGKALEYLMLEEELLPYKVYKVVKKIELED